MEVITLIEGDQEYELLVNLEDSRRAENDMEFAQSLLAHKKRMLKLGIDKNELIAEPMPGSSKANQNGQYTAAEETIRTVDLWSEPETKFVLDKYEMYLSQVGPMKKFKTKKCMWLQISKDLDTILNISKTPLQIENRYKTILKRKKKAVEHNSQTGRSREEVPYEEELKKISNLDDSIEPEVLRSSHNVRYLKNETKPNSFSSEEESVPKKRKSNTDTLMELHKMKEEAKERRHKDKMDLLRELFGAKSVE